MGDTPALLYMMNGSPNDPESEHWGGSFEKMNYSPRTVFTSTATVADTVPVYSIIEFRFKGPKLNIAADSTCFTLIARTGNLEQKWPGYYVGNGEYVVRYTPKQAETLQYQTTSIIAGFPQQSGTLVVNNNWPGNKHNQYDFKVGPHWYTDRKDLALFQDQWQGAETIGRWRKEVLLDWAERWKWLQ